MTPRRDAYRGIVAAVDRMVNRGDEADAVLRAVVDLLQERLGHVSWVGISLVEGGALELGPSRGERAAGSAIEVPVEYERRLVGQVTLESDDAAAFDEEDRRSLERVATLISQHALVAGTRPARPGTRSVEACPSNEGTLQPCPHEEHA